MKTLYPRIVTAERATLTCNLSPLPPAKVPVTGLPSISVCCSAHSAIRTSLLESSSFGAKHAGLLDRKEQRRHWRQLPGKRREKLARLESPRDRQTRLGPGDLPDEPFVTRINCSVRHNGKSEACLRHRSVRIA